MIREDEKRVVLKESQTRGGTVDGTVHRKHVPEDKFTPHEASSDDDNCTANVGPAPPSQAVSSLPHAPDSRPT